MINPQIGNGQQADSKDDVSSIVTVSLPGTSIAMNLPAVFRFDPAQSAFIYYNAAASVSIKEVAGTPYQSLVKSVNRQSIESQRMKLVETLEITTQAGRQGTLFQVQFTAQGGEQNEVVEFERILFFTGDENHSIWVTVNYPLVTKSLLESILRECLLTIKF